MSELYSFDKVGKFNVVVEKVGNGYEGTIYQPPQIPQKWYRSTDAEEIRVELMNIAKNKSQEKWFWMMDYCKLHGLPPAQNWAWERAEKAFEEKINE